MVKLGFFCLAAIVFASVGAQRPPLLVVSVQAAPNNSSSANVTITSGKNDTRVPAGNVTVPTSTRSLISNIVNMLFPTTSAPKPVIQSNVTARNATVQVANATIPPRVTNVTAQGDSNGTLIFAPVKLPGVTVIVGARPTTQAPTTTMKATTLTLGSGGDNSMILDSVNATAVVFDCRRYQHDCDFNGGLCDMDTGTCACNDGYAGFDCSFKEEMLRNASECNAGSGCGETGQCVTGSNSNPKATVCECGYGQTGQACNQAPIQLQCTDTTMVIQVVPFPAFASFEGLLYMVNMTLDTMVENTGCRFQQGPGFYRFEATYIDIMTKCGGMASGENAYSAKFIVQSDPHWLTPYDQVFNVKCVSTLQQSYERAVIVSVSGSASAKGLGQVPVGVSNSLTNLPLNHIVAEHKRFEAYDMPKLSLSVGRIIVNSLYGNYTVAPLSEQLRIGDPVMITVTNVNNTFYTSLRPEDCLLKMDNSIEMKLITRACPASKFAWSLLRWDRTIVTNSSVSIWLLLPANALAGQTRFVDIYCRVKVCTHDADSDCAFRKDACSANQMPPGRRRREVDPDLMSPEGVEDFFSSYPFVYTTVHSRFRLSYDDDEGNRGSVISDTIGGQLSRSSTAPTIVSPIVTLSATLATLFFRL